MATSTFLIQRLSRKQQVIHLLVFVILFGLLVGCGLLFLLLYNSFLFGVDAKYEAKAIGALFIGIFGLNLISIYQIFLFFSKNHIKFYLRQIF